MTRLTLRLAATLLTLAALCQLSCSTGSSSRPAPPAILQFDLVVYGGTAAGTMAAISAAQEGLKVALVEPGNHVGGMVSGGLGYTDVGNKAVIGGRSLEFFKRVGAFYGKEIAWDFEPRVAEKVLRDWLAEAGVQLAFGHHIVKSLKTDRRITSIETDDGTTYLAGAYIDASYEGDLMAKSGTSYTVGRESRSQYGEPHAGVLAYNGSPNDFQDAITGFDSANQLLPLITGAVPGNPGDGDNKIQAYNYRLCLTDDPGNLVPFPRPAGYDPARYQLLQRYIQSKGPSLTLGNLLYLAAIPNRKADVNNRGPVSTDFIGGSWEYPEADYPRREEIKEEHKRYIQGLLYFLAHDPSVPATVQWEINQYGLAKDEFTDTGHWPHQLYVREGRRLIGSYVMIEPDLDTRLVKQDSIGMGSYNADSHHVQRYVTATGVVRNEGNMEVPVSPYEIPYSALTPKATECENLLVPVCLSASHVAFSSLRMEPQSMIMGQAAGQAAYLALRDKTSVQGIDVTELRSRLRSRNQVLSLQDANLTNNAPPTGSIQINGGASATSSASLVLTLSAASAAHTVTQMQFSKNQGVSWSAWEPYAGTKTLTLAPEGNGPKTVAVRYQDSWDNVSRSYQATITLNAPPPAGP